MARRNPRIKKANTEVEFTAAEIEELRRCSSDPVYFISHYVKVQHPTKGIIPFKLYDYQIKMVDTYKNNRYSVVLSARQTGKEQPHSAKVATPGGWSTMGDIQSGDVVLTPDGNRAKVLQKFHQGVKDVYRIDFDDGSYAECGLDHLWDVYIRNKWDPSAANGHGGYVVNRQVLTLREMIDHFEKNKDRKNHKNYNIRIPVVSKVDFEEKELPLDPYVLGLILGDGGISRSSTISFTTKDEGLVESIKGAISQHDSIIKLRESGNSVDYFITSPNSRTNNIVGILKRLGLMGTKSDTKFIPEIYQTASHEQRLSLLQGLMDTDGTVGKRGNKRTISYCTTSCQLRDDVQHLVRGLGGKCSYYTRYPQNQHHKVAYDLYISLPSPKDCFRLERKRNLCHNVWHNNVGYEHNIRRTVTGIKRIRQEECSCILIDHPDHLYITDDFTVTHNSVTAAAFILWYAIFNFDKTVLIASNKNSNAMEMIHRIRIAYENLPMWLKPGVTDDGWNKHSVGFDNGTRIMSEATSENSGRGLAISLLYLDEFAFVTPTIQEEFWTSISPTLSTGGSCIMTSTPNGDMDIFAQIWRGAQVKNNGFIPIRVYWDEPPGRDAKFKEEETGRIGERRWMQEYECCGINTIVTIMDESGNVRDITMGELYDEMQQCR